MTNEEFQKIVLQELKTLKEGQQKLEEGQQKLEEGQQKLEEGQQKLEEGQKEIRKELNFVWEDIKRIDNRLEKQEVKIRKVLP